MEVECGLVDNLSQLITKAKEGDKDAFGQIYNLFYTRIFRYCKFNLAHGPDEAQDICQETFLKTYKSLSKFTEKKGGSFQAYLFRIATNLIIDFKRKKKDVPLKDYQDFEAADDLGEQIDKNWENQKLKNAIDKLKQVERQIVILRYFEDLTTAEVAKVVGMRQGALRVRSHRILKKLKDLIERSR